MFPWPLFSPVLVPSSGGYLCAGWNLATAEVGTPGLTLEVGVRKPIL